MATGRPFGMRRWLRGTIETDRENNANFLEGGKPGSRIVRGPKQTVVVRLPKQYRHMTVEEFIAAGKEVLKQLLR